MPDAPLWTSAQIVTAAGGAATRPFSAAGVSIDSRSLAPGDLFIALRGVRDGHEFLPAAFAAGAGGALATRPGPGPTVVVEDTMKALHSLATEARDRSTALRGAVTGSVGKTSVTQAVAAGLARAGAAHASVKSYNNHIGVPLTLVRMPAETERAIFEIGMNHAGELAPLARLVRPHAVAVTNVEAVHVENFPDGEAGVARAKAEIFDGVDAGAVAILNADNRWFATLASAARGHGLRVISFGRAEGADARMTGFTASPAGASVAARIDGGDLEFPIRQSGVHWGPMSLCALLMMRALEVDLDTGLAALAEFAPLPGRGSERRLAVKSGAALLIDESYNASPISMAAALAGLGARGVVGRRIVALTDMLELGPDAAERHAELAGRIAEANIDMVFCAGPLMHSLWDALPAARRGAWAEDAEGLAPPLVAAVEPDDIVMVKGSHASGAHRLAERLGDALTGIVG